MSFAFTMPLHLIDTTTSNRKINIAYRTLSIGFFEAAAGYHSVLLLYWCWYLLSIWRFCFFVGTELPGVTTPKCY